VLPALTVLTVLPALPALTVLPAQKALLAGRPTPPAGPAPMERPER